MPKNTFHLQSFTAIDLFSGAGGLSTGLEQAGFTVKTAVEIDQSSAHTYSLNHPRTVVIREDIRNLTGPTLLKRSGLKRGELDLLTGCPPCQGFSSLQTKRKSTSAPDPRNELIFEILRLIRSMRPKTVVIENVPGLAEDVRFDKFCGGLTESGYNYEFSILDAKNFGVPQRRRRLVLVASRIGKVQSAWPNLSTEKRTVRDTISNLPLAGSSGDPLHDFPENRSKNIMDRIRATPKDGGSRKDVASKYTCDCHTKSDGFNDVYGRMAWDEVAPTITSGCTNPSKGRFLHPEEHRAITLREAALLQSFPNAYKFDLSRGKGHTALQIGNAFPPRLITPIAKALIQELAK